jgi:hypothetical protein
MKLGNIKSNKTFEQITAYRGKPQAEKLTHRLITRRNNII